MTLERATPWIVGSLIVVLFFQAVLSMWNDSPTFDEMVNPSVGYAELFDRDLSLYHDHPPLSRVFTALPLLAFKPVIPFNHDSWQRRSQGMKDRYDFAHEFFYVANQNAQTMLNWSRLPVVLLSLLLGLLVFKWAQLLYGNGAGIFALFLYCFEPNILAHSRLATNDLIVTLFIFATLFQFWRYTQSPTLRSLVLTGITLGLALISKFSAVMLFPMIIILALLAQKGGGSNENANDLILPFKKYKVIIERIPVALKTVALISVVAICVVLLFYGTQWQLYIKGFYDTMAHYEGGHNAFLMGKYSTDGWWSFFPIAFLMKTPIPFLMFILISFLFLSFKKEKVEYFLLIPVGIIGASALLSHINIGIRHILPIYPFLIVLASSVTMIKFSRPRIFGSCFAGLGLWYVFSTVSIFPSYLAYFNEVVGPERGYHYLADSNLDWGQDLKRLKMFMDKKGIKKLYLSYFGTADPCFYGIKPIYLPGSLFRCRQEPEGGGADFIAISATNLQSVYLPDRKSFDWLKAYEPIGRIGYSIFVYKIQGDVSAHNNLGILYLNYGMVKDAIKEFKLMVDLSPKEPMAYSNLGYAYSRLSSFDRAEAAYREALKLDSDNSVAKAGLKGIERLKKKKHQRL